MVYPLFSTVTPACRVDTPVNARPFFTAKTGRRADKNCVGILSAGSGAAPTTARQKYCEEIRAIGTNG